MTHQSARLKTTIAAAACLAVALGSASCSDTPKGVTGEPTVDVQNKDLQANQRIRALEATWEDARTDPGRMQAARDASKDMLWKSGAPTILRQRALELLLTDNSPEGLADTRKFLRLRMPTENQWPLIVEVCKAVQARAADPAWKDQTASLVRSYARKVPVPPDDARPEKDALLALHPGRELSDIVFGVYVRPAENGAPKVPDDSEQRSRDAAWDLLGRIDPDGSKRAVLAAREASTDPAIRDVNRIARELGVVPITGSELAWMRGLMDDKDKRNSAWWSATTQAVGSLSAEQKRGLQMRHLELLRWAAANRAEWARATREQLISELTSRLGSRRIWLKTEGLGQDQEKSRETLRDWEQQLVWGDVLSVLVLDEAMNQPGIVAELFKQAMNDQADTTTEYGGVLWASDQGGAVADKGGKFNFRAYAPRTTERKDDRTFMAPEEMFSDSARSLAHYHFHVQTANNRDYAGPGRGDMEYAANHGRNCIVLTTVSQGVMNVDYYQRNGAVIDLGEIAIGK